MGPWGERDHGGTLGGEGPWWDPGMFVTMVRLWRERDHGGTSFSGH